MNHFTLKILLPGFIVALAFSSCQKKQGTVWDDNKTASQLNHGGSSLWGADGEDSSLAGPVAEDFIPLQEEDLKAQLADGAIPQPFETPGEDGSSLPNAAQFHAPSGELAAIFHNLYFNTDDHILRGQEQLSMISAAAAYLKAHPKTFVFVAGHCDQRGPQAYNLALGSRRANYIRTLLVERGVDPNQLHTISYGKEQPLDPRNISEAWSKNRRAEFKIFNKS
ncbi:MAG: OmpA family protein [Simkania sp.]|nr:OmpA family protein [Simkania sp.]